jgi:hypothetical protein
MKIKSLFVAVLLMAGVVVAPANAADDAAWQKPVLKAFSFTPNDVELSSGKTDVEITLTVVHPLGISNQNVVVHLENSVFGGNFAYSISISRTDAPVDSKLSTVTFKGIMKLDPSMPSGVWEFRSESLTPNSDSSLENFTPRSATFTPPVFRDFAGGETALLVRKSGNLNFDFKTFVGPVHLASAYVEDGKPLLLSAKTPIWRVKESYDPKEYFQLRTNKVSLQVSSATPLVCSVSNSILNFLSTGSCQYRVFTAATKDYLAKELYLTVDILPERQKFSINPPIIPTQIVTKFPTVVTRAIVTSFGAAVNPVAETPTVCVASGVELTLYSTGTCTFSYFSAATESQYASDVVKQTFKVLKEGELEVVPTPAATPTPTPVATPTAKPVVKKTITCVKGTKTIKKTAVSPKCPAGYKLKK